MLQLNIFFTTTEEEEGEEDEEGKEIERERSCKRYMC